MNNLSSEVINHSSGNSPDPCSKDVRKSKETFKQLSAPDRLEHCVIQKPIMICDLFDADNLAMDYVSIAVFDDTAERNNFRKRPHTGTYCKVFMGAFQF